MTDENRPLVLIVDDNVNNLKVLGNQLKEFYKTAVALNGIEAVNFISNKIPDLVLLDIMMPEMDGFEACNVLKKNPETKDIPIIFLSAKIDKDSIVKGFDLGAADYITKPFNQSELLARVKTHLSLKNALDTQKKMVLEKQALVSKLEQAIEEIKTLKGIIPICCICKKIRNDEDYWEQVESYIQKHTDASFTHGYCPKCIKEHYSDYVNADNY